MLCRLSHLSFHLQDAQKGGNNTMIYAQGRFKVVTQNWFENKYYYEMSTHNRSRYAYGYVVS